MRSLLAATALLALMGATPGTAREYAWCARTDTSGFNPSCDFATYQQCRATVSGQAGDCIANPALAAYGQYDGPNPATPAPRYSKRRY